MAIFKGNKQYAELLCSRSTCQQPAIKRIGVIIRLSLFEGEIFRKCFIQELRCWFVVTVIRD
jgi:hypothetical protein